MQKLDTNIPNRIAREINKVRHMSAEDFAKRFHWGTKEFKHWSGCSAEVFEYPNMNLVIKHVCYQSDPWYIAFAKIAQAKHETNPLYPHIYHIEGDIVFCEKLEHLDDDDMFENKKKLSRRFLFQDDEDLRTDFENDFEKEFYTDLTYLIDELVGDNDVYESNILFRDMGGIYHPVIVDPICGG